MNQKQKLYRDLKIDQKINLKGNEEYWGKIQLGQHYRNPLVMGSNLTTVWTFHRANYEGIILKTN